MANLLSTSIAGQLTVNSGRLLLQTGGVNTYGIVSGYNNNNHFITMRGSVSGSTSSPTFGGAHQMTFVEYAEAGDSTGWYFKSSSSGTYEEIARITRSGINWSGNNVIHSGGGQTINGITYFSNGESLSLYGIRGRFTNEYIHLYEKVGIGHPSGWGQGQAETPSQGLSTYGGMVISYGTGATSTFYGRIDLAYSTDRYQLNFRGAGNNWWITNDSDKLGIHLNNVGDRIYFATDGNIWSSYYNDWLSNIFNSKQNASTAITTSNIGSQSVSYASSAGNADTLDGYHSNTVGNRHHTARGFYVDGDQNTYYPVLISGSGNYAFNRYSIYRFYGWEAPWDPIGTGAHKGGLTFDVEWSGDIAWGGNDKTLRVVQFSETYTTMVAGMTLPVTGGLCVWLRGGHAYYEIQVDAYPNTPTVYLDGFTAANGAFYGPREDTSNVQSEIYNRMPVRGSSELYDGGSRVITSGNIGSQSVSYATNSGNSATTSQRSFDYIYGTSYLESAGGVYGTIFYDNNDRSYYVDPNGLSRIERLQVVSNWGGSTPNDGQINIRGQYPSMTFRNTVSNNMWLRHMDGAGDIQHYFAPSGVDETDWSIKHSMRTDGTFQSNGSMRAPIFYDSNDTTYYLDPNNTLKSLNIAGNIDLIARSAGWAEGIRVRVPSTSTWGGIRFTRDRGNNDGNWAIGFTGIDSTDDLTFWGNNGGTEGMKMRLDQAANLITYGSMRAPIFYDSNDTYYYVDPNSMSRISSARIVGGELRFHNGSYYSDLNYWGARFYSQDDGNGVPLYVQVQWVDGWRTSLKIASGIDDNNPSLRTYGRTQLATDGGFVGVATTSPFAELDVNGRLAVRGGNRLYWGATTTLGSWTTAQYASGSTHLFNAQRFDFTNEGYGSTTFAIINSEGVYTNNSILFPQTQFSPSAGSRTLTPPMSIRMFDNYFSGIGLGSDYGTVLEYYSRIGHVDTQVYFDAAGGSWYRTAQYAGGYSAWNQYITSGNIGSQNVNASNYQYATGSSSDAIESFRQTPAHATSFREISSSGPGGTWWMIQNFRHSNSSNYWGTQVAWGWEDNALRLMQRNVSADSWSGWVEYLNTNNAAYAWNMNQYVRTSDAVTFASTTTQTFLIASHSDNTKGYRIYNTSNSSVSAMFVNSSNQLVIAAGAVDQVNLNKKVLVNGVALGVNVAPSATAGRIDASNDIVAYSSSDERLKENITPIENALDKVKSLTGVEFDWKPEYKHAHGYEGHDTGIIAQQVEAVMPSAVRTNDTGFLAVRYEKLIGLLIEGMKEQQAQIDELKAKLDGITK